MVKFIRFMDRIVLFPLLTHKILIISMIIHIFRKIIELASSEIPIYISGNSVKMGIFAGLLLRLCDFLPI